MGPLFLFFLACAPKPPEAGDIWQSPALGSFRWISPGSFTMGSPESEEGRDSIEVEHPVTLTFGFWLMDHEVNEREWAEGTTNRPMSFPVCGEKCPLVNVSWNEVQEFVGSLLDREGRRYFLPTEAEWEYAARGGEGFVYAGSDTPQDVAWYSENSDDMMHDGCLKQRNGYGLCDMSGNVSEWVWDYFSLYPQDQTIDQNGPDDGVTHVLRGGDWRDGAENVRVARRGQGDPDVRSDDIGFRLALSEI